MKLLFLIFFLFIGCALHAQPVDSFEIQFNLGDAAIPAKSKQLITQLIANNKLQPGQRLNILGYTDYLGTDSINNVLSQRRAEAVKEYFINSGIKREDIKVCRGNGAIVRKEKTKEGNATDRKVQVVIYKPGTIFNDYTSIFRMDTLKVDDVVPLNNVHFEMGKTWIWPDRSVPEAAASYDELDKVVEYLKEFPEVIVRIEGHVCCPMPGDDGAVTHRMSSERAYTVMDYLKSKGIDKKRLSAIGFGTTKPFVNPERTPEDEALNRRVCIRIVSK